MSVAEILPGATLGVIGGGQLGRMFVHAAQQLGYVTAVLDPDPIQSPWNDAARAICDGELARAADIIDEIGHAAAAAYARLRATEALAAAGQDVEAAAQQRQAESFYRKVGAIRFMGDPRLAGESVANRRA